MSPTKSSHFSPVTQSSVCSFQELIDQLKDVVVEMLHTRDGSRVGLQCLWHGTAKVPYSRYFLQGANFRVFHDGENP